MTSQLDNQSSQRSNTWDFSVLENVKTFFLAKSFIFLLYPIEILKKYNIKAPYYKAYNLTELSQVNQEGWCRWLSLVP
jgi:hypothetical protein